MICLERMISSFFAKSKEHGAEGEEQRAESMEQRAESEETEL